MQKTSWHWRNICRITSQTYWRNWRTWKHNRSSLTFTSEEYLSACPGAWSCSVRIDLFDSTMFCITPLCKKEKERNMPIHSLRNLLPFGILFICARKTTLKAMDRDRGKVCRSGVSGLQTQIMGSGKFVNQIWPIITLGTKIVRRVGPAPLYSSYKTPQKRGGEEGANWLIVYQLFGHIFPLGNYFGHRFEHICMSKLSDGCGLPVYHVGTHIYWIILGTLYLDLYSDICVCSIVIFSFNLGPRQFKIWKQGDDLTDKRKGPHNCWRPDM